MAARGDAVSLLTEDIDEGSEQSSVAGGHQARYIICVDYGTTFTGAAWILTRPRTKPTINDIQVVRNWVHGADIKPKVPSEYTYSANSGQKWGFNIGHTAYIIKWTKLRLQVPSRLGALKAMRNALEEADKLEPGGPGRQRGRAEIPRHLIRTSAEIATDYLKEVIHQVRLDIEREKNVKTLEQFPIDVVITRPGKWDQRGRNLTFRAVMSAFDAVFRDIAVIPGQIRLATEPEACAQYTLQAARAADAVTTHQLRVGECFIVVDAGGGTVDLVSYRIDQLEPEFKFTRIGSVSSETYGATLIDRRFLYEFLPERLGPVHHERLLSLGGLRDRHGSSSHNVLKMGEQQLLEEFQRRKFAFAGGPCPDMVVGLPKTLSIPDSADGRIRQGQLLISWQDMEAMFSDCVAGIRDMIEKQLLQIDRARRRQESLTVRNIFLSGGFSDNEYLFKCVKELANGNHAELIRAKDAWTAVAQGGVLLGLGLECSVPPPVAACPYNLGVQVSTKFAPYHHSAQQRYKDFLDGMERAQDHIQWFALKGDLIEPDEPTHKTVDLVRKFSPRGSKTGRVTIIVSTADDPQHFSPDDE
ncbi:chaperone protein DnaK [Cladorrhinum samala]|uniref:Chaperone protein DnaK n=1 Tax=Cladorrhinum samala TaxID=585594 RepID=A0AAV9HI14_9PEZI|nr:chaperone protein DnaK [Cladorrhinum samala]